MLVIITSFSGYFIQAKCLISQSYTSFIPHFPMKITKSVSQISFSPLSSSTQQRSRCGFPASSISRTPVADACSNPSHHSSLTHAHNNVEMWPAQRAVQFFVLQARTQDSVISLQQTTWEFSLSGNIPSDPTRWSLDNDHCHPDNILPYIYFHVPFHFWKFHASKSLLKIVNHIYLPMCILSSRF